MARYVEEFGGDASVSPALRLRIERVAELQVLSAKARADCATGDISVDDMVRAQRLADHAENRLRGSITRRGPAPPSLDEIKARHRQDAEEAARASRRANPGATASRDAGDVSVVDGAPSAIPGIGEAA